MKPDWWEPWIPATCSNGHELGPGRVSLSWVSCSCAGGGAAHGHHKVFCRVDGCNWWMWPPEHVNDAP